MKAETRTLQQILHGDRRFVVPVYQRPYVWERDRQWEPLWEDVESTAMRLVEERVASAARGVPPAEADRSAPPHFLGAIVLEQHPTATGDLDVRWVIDGQQRLTTLQLLLRGVLDALGEVGVEGPSIAKLRKLIRNDPEVVAGEAVHKIWPRPAEQAAYIAAMQEEQPAEDDSSFAAARAYFYQAACEFMRDEMIPDDPFGGSQPVQKRASLLVATLLGLVKLVVIDLENVDDAQVIFEALNARNTPLSATDLVKNLLFMRAHNEGVAPQALYEEVWARFDEDADWWRQSVGIGHAQRARQDWLLGDWLIAELGQAVNVGRLYSEFRRWLDASGLAPVEALKTLNRYADAYQVMQGRRPGATTVEKVAFHRLELLNITAVNPVLLWLLVQPPNVLAVSDRELSIRAIEAFVVRRMAAKWQTRAYGQVFVEVLRAARSAVNCPGRAVIEALRASPHGYSWAGDSDLVDQFVATKYYGPGGVSQTRLRLLLGAIDFLLQADVVKSEPVDVRYDKLQVEHILPQDWRHTWPVRADDEGERLLLEQRRESHVHRIGNLTLVSDRLNPALSNDAWEAKRAELRKHSKLRLNALLCEQEGWDEERVVERSRWLATCLSRVWPGPESSVWSTQSEALPHDSQIETGRGQSDDQRYRSSG